MLVDVFARGITGKVAEAALDQRRDHGQQEHDPLRHQPPMVTSGIRIGTPALTTRGMKEPEMEEIGRLISRALQSVANETELAEVKRRVRRSATAFRSTPRVSRPTTRRWPASEDDSLGASRRSKPVSGGRPRCPAPASGITWGAWQDTPPPG